MITAQEARQKALTKNKRIKYFHSLGYKIYRNRVYLWRLELNSEYQN